MKLLSLISRSMTSLISLIQYYSFIQIFLFTGISLAGIIRDGYMDFCDQKINVLGPLNKRYPNKRFYLFNDVNTLVSGYYISQNKYQTISFLYQPSMGSPCGIGSVFKGQLIEGAHKIAGEAKYCHLIKNNFKRHQRNN